MLKVVHFYLSDVGACHSIIDILLSLLSPRITTNHSLVLYIFLARVCHKVGYPEHLSLGRPVATLPQQVLSHNLLVKLCGFSVFCGPVAVGLSDGLL